MPVNWHPVQMNTNAKCYTAPPTAPRCTSVHQKSGDESDDEDLPGLDVGGARGAVYEVVAASDHKAKNKNTGQEYGQYGLAACRF